MAAKTKVKEVRAYHSVQDTLARINVLREEMNGQLYDHPAERPLCDCPQALANMVRPFLEGLDHEEFYVICLDTKNRLLSLTSLYKGTLNTAPVRVAEVMRAALMVNASAIALAHNHPSGDPQPSIEDASITRAIVEAGRLLEIDVLDHVVIGSERRHVSLKERGIGGF